MANRIVEPSLMRIASVREHFEPNQSGAHAYG
jgi:hypothetical protein